MYRRKLKFALGAVVATALMSGAANGDSGAETVWASKHCREACRVAGRFTHIAGDGSIAMPLFKRYTGDLREGQVPRKNQYVLYHEDAIDVEDVTTDELGLESVNDMDKVQRACNRWGGSQDGFATGFWNGHKKRCKNGQLVIGVVKVREEAVEHRNLDTERDLGGRPANWAMAVAAADSYAEELSGFVAGFVSAERDRDHNDRHVHGVWLVRPSYAVVVAD